MQKILNAPILIGIRRAVLEYSFENFTIQSKKKNGKARNKALPLLDKLFVVKRFHNSKFSFSFLIFHAAENSGQSLLLISKHYLEHLNCIHQLIVFIIF